MVELVAESRLARRDSPDGMAGEEFGREACAVVKHARCEGELGRAPPASRASQNRALHRSIHLPQTLGMGEGERLLAISTPPFMSQSIDDHLEACGSFGKAQCQVMLVAFCGWVVHGAQVMSMAFVAPAASQEFANEATAVKMSASFFFLGWFLGLYIWGSLASRKGWLPTLGIVEILVAITGCATAVASSGESYLVTRFLCGLAEGGVPTTSYGWAGEFLLPRHKPRAGNALHCGFCLGSLLVTLASYQLGEANWRQLSATISLCAIPIAGCCLVVPESPRWLRRAGYDAKANAVLRKIARLNGHEHVHEHRSPPVAAAPSCVVPGDKDSLPMPSLPIPVHPNEPKPHDSDVQPAREDTTPPGHVAGTDRSAPPKKATLVHLLLSGSRTFPRVVLVLTFQWFVYSALFFGLSLHEAHNIRTTLLTASFQIPTTIITALAFDRYGRRATMFWLFAAIAACCAAMAFLSDGAHSGGAAAGGGGGGGAHIGIGSSSSSGGASRATHGRRMSPHAMLAVAGMACTSGAFAGGYVLSSELLPTDVRATGLALCSQCSRVGGFFSPFALLIQEPSTPYVLWAVLALAAGLSTLSLPETLGESSVESVDDLDALAARQRMRCQK